MPVDTLEVGTTQVRALDDGIFVTDAGNLFGRGAKRARIRGAMHPVLVSAGDALILLDAGFGSELPETLRDRYELQRERTLEDHLADAGYGLGDITHVILSHLDADHVGWALSPRSLPKATVYVQKAALYEARQMPDEHGRKEAVPTIELGIREGWCRMLDGDAEIVPGVRTEVRSGHAAGHQVVWIESGGQAALFTADLAPSRIFLNPDLISGADTDPEAARRNRIEVLTEAEERNTPVILYHEPSNFVVAIRKTRNGFEGVPWES